MIKAGMLSLFLFVFGSMAAEKANVALKNLTAEGIDSLTAELVTDRIRLELFRTDHYNVMERREMHAVLDEQKITLTGICDETNCDVELGKILSVEKIITGSVGKVDSLYLLSLRVIDVETAQITQVADVDVVGSLQELFSLGVPALVNELIGVGTVSLITQEPISVDVDTVEEKEEKPRYAISYRQRLKEENRKRQGITIDTTVVIEKRKKERRVRVKGPNIIAAATSVGALIAGVKVSESENEYDLRAQDALKGGDLISAAIYKKDAKRRRVAKSILFGVSGVSIISFIVSF